MHRTPFPAVRPFAMATATLCLVASWSTLGAGQEAQVKQSQQQSVAEQNLKQHPVREQMARDWEISPQEYERYESLMQGPRGIYSPGLDPLTALFTLLTFCVRLVVLALTLPLFAMAAFTGLVDGLVRRDLRKFGAGRESSYLYHKARGTIVPLTILPWTLYLAIPISLSPLLVLMPCAVLLGLSISITASTFKKYL